ncbi:MAG: HAMP domain-containing histidine kinase [Comamonadaceae bacterium]|nr:MAG: HAMP domain-containing histidine kinase [Comamonadaceae bacterium]
MRPATRRWLGPPTLTRRVFAVVLLAFVAVLIAVQAYMYWGFKRSLAEDQGLSRLGRTLRTALATADDPAQALAMMRATAAIYDKLRLSGNPPGSLALQLRTREGALLYSSPVLQGRHLSGPAQRVSTGDIDGTPYWFYPTEAGRWQLLLAEPERTLAKVLRNNTRVVLPYLLVALPIVLIPVWLAVRLGLRPLRQLAQRLAEREPLDLSALKLEPRHAELKPLVAALDALLAQLRARVARERAFVQDAAHELRTPMAVIAAQAHALGGATTDAQRREAQQQLEHAIARASHLTQQLLELARLDDAQRVPGQRIDVAQQVRQTLAHTAPLALARGVELTLVAPDHLWAQVEPSAFQSIVQNLLDNAIGHTGPGTQIVVTLAGPDAELALSVEDDGPGVAPAQSDQLFERFYRGADAHGSGSGLGLAIVRQAATRMGGQVALSPGLRGVGAGFHVRLPQHPRVVQATPA